MEDAVRRVINLAVCSTAVSVRLANAYCVAVASGNPTYASLLNGRGINFPDGTPVAWFMRRRALSLQRPERVRGPSLFTTVIDLGRDNDLNHYFLGATPETIERMISVLNVTYPGVKIAGVHCPPFSSITESYIVDCAERIRRADPQIVWVALGTPKQDFVAAELSERISRPCVAVGAAFDFTAGTVREAPVWTQDFGVEWLFRLCMEPRRLWRRYLLGNLRFLYSAINESRG